MTIDEETACYGKLDQLLIDERAAVAHAEKDRLEEIHQLKESLVANLQRYERKRASLVDRLADTYGQVELPITATRLASLIGSPENAALLNRTDRLRSVVEAARKKNRQNQLLIRQSLDLVNSALKLLTQHIVSNSTYQKAGQFDSFPGYRSGCGRILRGTV